MSQKDTEKKFLVLPFDYEYNDNTYDQNGIEYSSQPFKLFTKAEALAEHRKMTIESFKGSRLADYCEDRSTLEDVADIFGDRADWDWNAPTELTDAQEKKVFKLIKDVFYVVEEMSGPQDTFHYDGKYGRTKSYSFKQKNDHAVLHNTQGPAVLTGYEDEDDEDYGNYYLEGKTVPQDHWKAKIREYKIDAVVE